jgi:O-antigen/teichoic acid export membrane protein
MDKTSATYKTIRNVAYNFSSYIWTIILAFVTLPIIINGLGTIEYGYYIFVGTILSFLGLLDLGIASALNKFIAEKYGQNDIEKLKEYIGVSKFLFYLIAIIGFLITILIALTLKWGFDQKYSFLFIPVLISAFTFVFSSIQSLITITLQSIQRFDTASKMGIFLITLQQISIVSIALTTKNISHVFLVQLIVSIISYIIGYKIVYRHFPYIKSKINYNFSLIKELYKYGIKTLFINFSNSLLTYFDRLLIPIFLGPQSLTYYTAPGSISTKIPTLATNVGSIVFSTNSLLEGSNDKRRQKILYEKSLKFVFLVSMSLAFSITILSKKILEYWLGLEISTNSYVVLIFLSITSVLLAIYSIIQNTLFSINKFKEISILSYTMLAINVITLFIFIPIWGINGAAFSYLLSMIPVVWFKFYVDKKYFETPFKLKNELINLIKFTLTLLVTYLLIDSLSIYINNLISVIIIFAISNIIFLTLLKIFGFIKSEELVLFKKFFKKQNVN